MVRKFSFLTLTLGVVATFCVPCVIVSISACGFAPRNATMCVKNNDWVKCPVNVSAGSTLDKKAR